MLQIPKAIKTVTTTTLLFGFTIIGNIFVNMSTLIYSNELRRRRALKNSSNDFGSWMVGEDDKGWDNGKWGRDEGLSVDMSKMEYQLAARYMTQQQKWGEICWKIIKKQGFIKPTQITKVTTILSFKLITTIRMIT